MGHDQQDEGCAAVLLKKAASFLKTNGYSLQRHHLKNGYDL